jgi:hypothetical protein
VRSGTAALSATQLGVNAMSGSAKQLIASYTCSDEEQSHTIAHRWSCIAFLSRRVTSSAGFTWTHQNFRAARRLRFWLRNWEPLHFIRSLIRHKRTHRLPIVTLFVRDEDEGLPLFRRIEAIQSARREKIRSQYEGLSQIVVLL